MRKDHAERTITFFPLREVVVPIRCNPTVETKHWSSIRKPKTPPTAVGHIRESVNSVPNPSVMNKTLKLEKKLVFNNFGAKAPLFLSYLKTLLYSYVLCSMKDEIDSMMLT